MIIRRREIGTETAGEVGLRDITPGMRAFPAEAGIRDCVATVAVRVMGGKGTGQAGWRPL